MDNLFLFGCTTCVACGISRTGIEPTPTAVEALSLNGWTSREVPDNGSFKKYYLSNWAAIWKQREMDPSSHWSPGQPSNGSKIYKLLNIFPPNPCLLSWPDELVWTEEKDGWTFPPPFHLLLLDSQGIWKQWETLWSLSQSAQAAVTKHHILGSPRSWCQWIWFLVKTPFLAWDGCPLLV